MFQYGPAPRNGVVCVNFKGRQQVKFDVCTNAFQEQNAAVTFWARHEHVLCHMNTYLE